MSYDSTEEANAEFWHGQYKLVLDKLRAEQGRNVVLVRDNDRLKAILAAHVEAVKRRDTTIEQLRYENQCLRQVNNFSGHEIGRTNKDG